MTRFGTRTQKGAIDDGVNSAMRYYINNVEDLRRQQLIDTIIGLDQTRGGHALRRIDDSLKQRLKRVPDQEEPPEFTEDVKESGGDIVDEEDTLDEEDAESEEGFESEEGEEVVDGDEYQELESRIEESGLFSRLLETSESLKEVSLHQAEADDLEEMSFAESILADLREARGGVETEESDRDFSTPPADDLASSLDEFIDDQIIQAPKEEGIATPDTFDEDQVIFAPKESAPSGSEALLTSDNERVLHEIDELLSGVLSDMQDFRIHADIRESTDFLNVDMEDYTSTSTGDDQISFEESTTYTSAAPTMKSAPESKIPPLKSEEGLLKPKTRKTASLRSKARTKKPGAGKVSSSLRKKSKRSSKRKSVSRASFRSRALTGALLGAAVLAWQVYLAKFSL